MGTRRRVSIFIPAYNEVQNLEGAIGDVVVAAEAALEEYEILVVNDGSTDGTGELADRLARQHRHLRVLHQPRNLGIGAAYERAVNEARLDYFSFLPGDREVNLESIKAIFGAVGSADIVVPYHGNAWARPRHRRLLTWGFTSVVNILFRLKLPYYQGPVIYPTPLARELPKTSGGFYFLTEMLIAAIRAGHSWVGVGLIHQEREHGTSKATSLANVVNALTTIAQIRWRLR